MSSFLKAIDFLGIQTNLYTFSQKSYKTTTGGLLSLLSVIAMVIISGYFVVQTFTRKNISIMSSEDFNSQPFHNLSLSPVFFTIADSWGVPINNTGFSTYNVVPLYGIFNKTKEIVIYRQLKIVNCETFDKQILDVFNLKVISYGICVDPSENVTIFGKFGSQESFSFLNFLINKCVNFTGGPICKSNEEINYYMERAYAQVYNLDYFIDHNNFTTPAKLYGNANTIPISATVNKFITYSLKNAEYDTDEGLVFQDIKKHNFTTLDKITESVDLKKNSDFQGNFAYLMITMSSVKTNYSRRYLKLQNLLADIGGMVKGVMLIAALLETYLIEKFYWIALANFLFNSEDKEMKEIIKTGYVNEVKSIYKQLNINAQSMASEGSHVRILNRVSIKPKVGPVIASYKSLFDLNSKNKEEIQDHQLKSSKKIEIIKHKVAKIELKDFLCNKYTNPRSKTFKIIDLVEKYVSRKNSIEYIINKLNEIDKLKVILFDEVELSAFKFIKNSYISEDKSKKINIVDVFDVDSKNDNDRGKIKQLFTSEDVVASKKLKKIMNYIS